MKFLPIIGTNYQNLSTLGNISEDILLLSDNVGQNPYTRFYKHHDLKIIDNMVYEKRESVCVDDLLVKAELADATEIIVPDVLYDGQKTLKSACNFIEVLSKKEINRFDLQCVPQGKDLADYLKCFKDLIYLDGVSVLGLSCLAIPFVMNSITYTCDVMTNRISLVCILESEGLLSEVSSNLIDLHCLGLGTNSAELYLMRNLCRSCDSSLPFWSAQCGIDLSKGSKYKNYREKQQLHRLEDMLMPDETELAVKNIKYCIKISECD